MDLVALKRQYRHVFRTELAGTVIFWRGLNLREHQAYSKMLLFGLESKGVIEDQIFSEIVLNKEVVNFMFQLPAGIVPSIVEVALYISGNNLSDESDLLRLNRDIADMRNRFSTDPYEQLVFLICKAFPVFKPQEIEELEYREMIRLIAMAEKMLGLEEPIKIVPLQKELSAADKVMKDKAKAEQVDRGAPPASDIRDILSGRASNVEQARAQREEEMRRLIREKQTRQS